MASKGWIGVDLDGTLAQYNGWVSPGHIGPPVPLMVARVKKWLLAGMDVRIFTARVSQASDEQAVRRNIEAWCAKYIGKVLPITNVKDYAMVELWDDRAVQVEHNTGKVVGHSTRGLN